MHKASSRTIREIIIRSADIFRRDIIPSLIDTKQANLGFDGWARSQKKVISVVFRGLTTIKNILGNEIIPASIPYGVYDYPNFADAVELEKVLLEIVADIKTKCGISITSVTSDSDATTLLAAQTMMQKIANNVLNYKAIVDKCAQKEPTAAGSATDSSDVIIEILEGDFEEEDDEDDGEEEEGLELKYDDVEKNDHESNTSDFEKATKFLEWNSVYIDKNGDIDDDDEEDGDHEPLHADQLVGLIDEDEEEEAISPSNLSLKCCTHQISNAVKKGYAMSRKASLSFALYNCIAMKILLSKDTVEIYNCFLEELNLKSKYSNGNQVPPRPVITRFCYHLLCLKYLIKNYEALSATALYLNNKLKLKLKLPKKENIEKFMNSGGNLILDLLDFFSGRTLNNNLALIIPCYDYTIDKLKKYNSSAKDGFNKFRNGFIKKLTYFRGGLVENQLICDATVLDGRFSTNVFPENSVSEATKKLGIKTPNSENFDFMEAVLDFHNIRISSIEDKRFYSDRYDSVDDFLKADDPIAIRRKTALMASTNSNFCENQNSVMRSIFTFSRNRMQTELLSSLTVLRSTREQLVLSCIEKAVRETVRVEKKKKRERSECVRDICRDILSKKCKND